MKKLVLGVMLVAQTSSICFAETFFWEDKKGIHTTDDTSKLPPKFRANYEKYLKQNANKELKVEKTIPESAKNAVRALKKMEARCSSGLTVGDYSTALGDAAFEVNMFVESKEANDFLDLKKSVEKTIKFYNTARDYFELNKIAAQRTRYQGQTVEGYREKIKNEELASKSISDASNELKISFALLNGK